MATRRADHGRDWGLSKPNCASARGGKDDRDYWLRKTVAEATADSAIDRRSAHACIESISSLRKMLRAKRYTHWPS